MLPGAIERGRPAGVTEEEETDLLVRCDPDRTEHLLDRTGAEVAQMGRRTMSKGWLRVRSAGIETDADLDFWIETALQFNAKHTS